MKSYMELLQEKMELERSLSFVANERQEEAICYRLEMINSQIDKINEEKSTHWVDFF